MQINLEIVNLSVSASAISHTHALSLAHALCPMMEFSRPNICYNIRKGTQQLSENLGFMHQGNGYTGIQTHQENVFRYLILRIFYKRFQSE